VHEVAVHVLHNMVLAVMQLQIVLCKQMNMRRNVYRVRLNICENKVLRRVCQSLSLEESKKLMETFT
jgi:hypothetical protein